jgi:hypothetical protein
MWFSGGCCKEPQLNTGAAVAVRLNLRRLILAKRILVPIKQLRPAPSFPQAVYMLGSGHRVTQ